MVYKPHEIYLSLSLSIYIYIYIYHKPYISATYKATERHLPQVEMAIASFAQFFLAFGDGIVQGHVSKPSLLTMQMRPFDGDGGDGMRLVNPSRNNP